MTQEVFPNWSEAPVLWRTSHAPVAYPDATAAMERMVGEVQAGGQESVWLLEHPPLYTAGTSAKEADLVDPNRFPVYASPRGGQYTYHGPGQRVAYLMLDLSRRKKDVRRFVQDTETWLIGALAELGVESGIRDGRVGVWVDRGDGREDKIAAIGVRIRKWVTFHGIALNISPDLSHFEGIVPCGIAEPQFGVTSLADLGHSARFEEADAALRRSFEKVFGPTEEEGAP
ncbi:lipoyl(octanoyl) transferase LipB [Parvularcula lutaonensis]|uniref:Octanoyltransferase n=1 Tax=Parvularcula lutaonensis TaxID=491923 RepID=A0ABV7MEX4_9PROT|nr:lipoyl(octanoyl) transferase LipB [Parvularcula lutaonensis]GGY52874.1 octanoyltransferase [Parvularcula lutaonensis]